MNEYLIYPKQLQKVSVPVEKKRCFVIMPFKDDMEYVYGVIKQGLNKAGYICNRVDEIGGATPIVNKILKEIICSRYIIADLTDCNPNVFYELGIAHSFKDAQNIIILKQQGSKVPFDITHLTYIEYDPNNAKFLTSAILKTLSENSYLADFREVLNIRGIIPYVKNDEELFITYLEKEFKPKLSMLISVLNNEITKFTSEDIENFISQYENMLGKAIISENDEILSGLFATYHEIIISLSRFPSVEQSVNNFLDGFFLERFKIKFEKSLVWKTDLAIALAKENKMINVIMPWIIRYFSQTKTASIDLNRYKLEAFLMTTKNNKVNEIICNALFDNNCYIREHMADIIGEKRLSIGECNLCRQLSVEENYYTAVSIMEALGKLRKTSAITYVLNWIKEHEQNILAEKQYFVLKHARIALAKLVDVQDTETLTKFDNKFQKYINDYFIL